MIFIRHLGRAFINSLHGLQQTWKTEIAFRLEVIGCAFVVPFTFWWPAPSFNKYFVIFSLSLMIIVELINTAIEKANDAFKKTEDPLIMFSKDAASASVFLSVCLVGLSLLNLVFF